MEEGNFASEVAQGYSVDNLSPSVPNTLEYEFIEDDNEVQITWDSEHDPDFNYYTIINNLDETVIHTTDNTHSFDFEESIEMDFNIAKTDFNGNTTLSEENKSFYIQKYDISYGNNLVSLPGYLENASSQDLLENLMVDIPNVVFMLGEGVGLFNTATGWSGNLNSILPTSGYWLNTELINTSSTYDWNLELSLIHI